ncbi:MAG: C69 family dipeptidase [Bacteroidales bacterium]|nr:C69 family dipeptidase [Bacteroidales bacterium]
MKHRLLLLASFMISSIAGMACTNLIVGKNASVDGSVMFSYSADSYGMFIGLYHFPAAKHAKGEMRKIRDWDSNKPLGEIPEARETYNVVGNMNEWQVSIGETTYGGREEMVDTTGIIDYGSLIYIALQRSKTARQAIEVMTTLANTYGYCSSGESFTICDPNEAWIMELQGKGPGSKGVVWVAQRIPDDCISAHANQSRIRQFDMNDKKNVMYSKDVIRFAREKGWFTGRDADFSWADAYAPADFGGRRYCDARVWSFFNRWSEGEFDEYLPWALGKDPDAKPMPLFIKPKRKLSVADLETSMRDHYEGTPMAQTRDNDPGQGLYASPYRQTPLSFKVDGVTYFNERPTSTVQSGFVFISQLRGWLPRQIGGVLWFGNDDANMVTFTPMYCSMTEQPECYNTPGADALTFSMDNAYWVCNWVSNMVYPRYDMLFPDLKAVRDSLDKMYLSQQKEIEREAMQVLETRGDEACAKFLNDYSVEIAQSMLETWRKLATYLIVKYNDMAVKPEKDGKFMRSPYGIGETVKRPGYNEYTRRQIAKQTGDWYKMPESK